MCRSLPFWLVIATCLLWPPIQAQAETISEKLTAAIYQEETAGNLPQAIKIYREIVDEGKSAAEVAAKAQWRLAMCLKKMGKSSEARAELESLVANFPDATDTVRQAKAELAAAAPLRAAPWKSGEQATLVMKLPAGQTIGMVGLNVEATQRDGKDAWRMQIHRYVVGGQNQGVTEVVADATSNRPWETNWSHLLLGDGRAQYGEKEVALTLNKPDGTSEEKSVPIEDLVYANDQVFYTLRQLPLEVGMKMTLPVFAEFGRMMIGIELTVPAMESIETPVGTFECFRVEMNIGQTFWITNTPERYVAKFDAESIQALLSYVGEAKSRRVDIAEKTASVEVPSGWHAIVEGGEHVPSAILVAPEMCAVVIEIDDQSDDTPFSIEKAVEGRKKSLGRRYKDYQMDPAGPQPAKLVGADAVRIPYSYEQSGHSFVGIDYLSRTDKRDILVTAHTLKTLLASETKKIDAIRDSLTIGKQ